MATIDLPEIIHEMLKNNGFYPEDPQASSIWTYTNQAGKKTYAVFMNEYYNDLHISPYVRSPKLLWSRKAGLTDLGRKEISG